MDSRTLFQLPDIHEIPVRLSRHPGDVLHITIRRATRHHYVRITHAAAAQLAAALSGALRAPTVLTTFLDLDGDGVIATREPTGHIRLTFSGREDSNDYAEFTDTDADQFAAALAAATGVPDIVPAPEAAEEFAESGMPPARTLVRIVDRLGDGDAVTIAEEFDTGGLIVAITYGDRDGFAAWVQISDDAAAQIAEALTRKRQPRKP